MAAEPMISFAADIHFRTLVSAFFTEVRIPFRALRVSPSRCGCAFVTFSPTHSEVLKMGGG